MSDDDDNNPPNRPIPPISEYLNDPSLLGNISDVVNIDQKRATKHHNKLQSNTRIQDLKQRITTAKEESLLTPPPPVEMLCNYFPVNFTTALVSMGGTGKSTWITRTLLQFIHDNHFATARNETLIITAEDDANIYLSKIYNALNSHTEEGNLYQHLEPQLIYEKFHILDHCGLPGKLTKDIAGAHYPSELAIELTDLITHYYPNVRLVVIETASRFCSAETNEAFEALVRATDGIAKAIQGACVIVHHTGKAQGRDGVQDIYAGRGGSSLGDNTRSFVTLTKVTPDTMSDLPVDTSYEDVQDGNVIEVRHIRNSYGKCNAPQWFALREGCSHGPVMERLEVMDHEAIQKAKAQRFTRQKDAIANAIVDVIKGNGGRVGRRFFESNTKEILGCSRTDMRAIVDEMLAAGTLVITTEPLQNGKGRPPRFLSLQSMVKHGDVVVDGDVNSDVNSDVDNRKNTQD